MKAFVTIFFVLSLFLQLSVSVKLGYIHNSPLRKTGWTLSHEKARLALEANNSDKLTSTPYFDMVQGPTTQALIDKLVLNGTDIIVLSTGQYIGDVHVSAMKYPNTFFIVFSDVYPFDDPNVGFAAMKVWEGEYLSGIIAGMITETNTIGLVTASENANSRKDVNAYGIGARRVNGNVNVIVEYIQSYHNESREFIESEKLMTVRNVDVMAQQTDTILPLMAAVVRDKRAIGWAVDMQATVGPEVVTSLVLDWVVPLQYMLDQYMGGSYNDTSLTRITWGVKEGLIRMAPFSAYFNESAYPMSTFYEQELANILDGKQVVFCGQYAKDLMYPTLPAGDCLTPDEMEHIANVLPFVLDDDKMPVPETMSDEDSTSDAALLIPFSVASFGVISFFL